MRLKEKFGQGLVMGFGIMAAIGIVSVAYAAYATLSVAGGDQLSSAKWNELVSYTVPPGAVMAFNLTSCPTGWGEYAPAYGRFIRGIDKSGTSIDPGGQRAPGNLQADDLISHNHTFDLSATTAGGPAGNPPAPTNGGVNSTRGTSSVGGTETRPRNVALLYCVKN